jgi:hypothetical protein
MRSEQLFESLAAAFAEAGVTQGTTFGTKALKFNRKAIACLHGEGMAFRLSRDTRAHAHAMALDGAGLFDPSGQHRPLKDWVLVPLSGCVHWQELAEAALDNLAAADTAPTPDALD